jgi:hypothetical protein
MTFAYIYQCAWTNNKPLRAFPISLRLPFFNNNHLLENDASETYAYVDPSASPSSASSPPDVLLISCPSTSITVPHVHVAVKVASANPSPTKFREAVVYGSLRRFTIRRLL